jgi:hypothetical protein
MGSAHRFTGPMVGGSGSEAGGSRGLVIHRVTKEINSSGTFSTLTKTNYHDWSTLM